MKIYTYTRLLLLIAIVGVLLTSCNDDNETTKPSTSETSLDEKVSNDKSESDSNERYPTLEKVAESLLNTGAVEMPVNENYLASFRGVSRVMHFFRPQT